METKTIYVVVTYKADVPDDMDNAEIQEAFQKRIEEKADRVRIHIKGYHDEELSEPLFGLEDVMAGPGLTIKMLSNL